LLEQGKSHYKNISLEYKQERDDMKAQLDIVAKKLEERNASIEKIEEEVARVNTHFERKKQELEKKHLQDIEAIELKNAVIAIHLE
jgi:dsDNA-specific endonuclease/ATPase MutS2